MLKRIIAFILIMVMTISLVACATEKGSAEQDVTAQKSKIANPFEDCNTLEGAAEIAGFTFEVPDMISGYERRTIQAVENDMIQVFYGDLEEKEAEKVLLRKAKGTEDISGDYTKYTENSILRIGEIEVNVRGEDSKIHVATWTEGEYTFAIDVNQGMDEETMTSLISTLQ